MLMDFAMEPETQVAAPHWGDGRIKPAPPYFTIPNWGAQKQLVSWLLRVVMACFCWRWVENGTLWCHQTWQWNIPELNGGFI